jgi:acyl-CoA thioesterase
VVVDRSWWSFTGAQGGALAAHALAALRAALPDPRSARTLSFTAHQGDGVALAGTAMFGATRTGPDHDARSAPVAAPAHDCAPVELPVPFTDHLEIRLASEHRPLGGGTEPELLAWMRFRDGRPLDADAVVLLTDALPPALFATWTSMRPVPSAELTVHLTDALDTAALADPWALVRIRTEHAGSGWAIDDSTLWTPDGDLVATGRRSRRVTGR